MENHKILIVEDEPKVATFIRQGLIESGFDAQIAFDGLIGKSMILTQQFDLAILDINLPHINGFELCKLIRDNNIQIPVLMLTALGGIDEKVQGFDAGADDYLLKPFEVRELVARIKALLKRRNNKADKQNTLRIADLEINFDEKRVMRSGNHITLRAKEYMLLEYFANNRNKVLSRLDISENVWGIKFDTGTNVVDVYVNFLRKKIDAGFEPRLIHTRIGLGYIFSEKPE